MTLNIALEKRKQHVYFSFATYILIWSGVYESHNLQNLDMDYNILYVIRRPDYLKDRRRDYLNNRRPDY
ncbi:hypothetical protein PFNF135_02368 [Plasmodium falciparum NF135/5.C10]|uniref:Uncharacterized protein n=1 Tax=Plasmodium falciparum NF135/5.C10 TaxID=1036726 RepID=W4IIH1_PLAFA|nr:hypothetical protein PFNF135_02368 [Plasmodium falciparum NF135/5.C10]